MLCSSLVPRDRTRSSRQEWGNQSGYTTLHRTEPHNRSCTRQQSRCCFPFNSFELISISARLPPLSLSDDTFCLQLPGPDTKGKVFDGWLHSSSTRKRVKGGDSYESEEDSDEGGETWYEREHLAEPPAGWHRPGHKKAAKGVTSKRQTKRKVPITHKMHKLTKDETPEAINRFRGNGADASPETIEEEVVDGKKPFGNGKKDRVNAASSPSSIAQKLHKEHRISMNINM